MQGPCIPSDDRKPVSFGISQRRDFWPESWLGSDSSPKETPHRQRLAGRRPQLTAGIRAGSYAFKCSNGENSQSIQRFGQRPENAGIGRGFCSVFDALKGISDSKSGLESRMSNSGESAGGNGVCEGPKLARLCSQPREKLARKTALKACRWGDFWRLMEGLPCIMSVRNSSPSSGS
jgi:hypothetical protein